MRSSGIPLGTESGNSLLISGGVVHITVPRQNPDIDSPKKKLTDMNKRGIEFRSQRYEGWHEHEFEPRDSDHIDKAI